MTYQPHQSEDVSLKTSCDNPRVLCQDCSRPLFRWFLSRIDWRRILKLAGSGDSGNGREQA